MIGPVKSRQDIYVAVCGQQFTTYQAGIEHERECQHCISGQKAEESEEALWMEDA